METNPNLQSLRPSSQVVDLQPPALGESLDRLNAPITTFEGSDVASSREQFRRRRLSHVAGLLAVVLVWSLLRAFEGVGLFPDLHVPHGLTPYLPAMGLTAALLVVMVGPMLGAGRSPHTLYRPEELTVRLDDIVGVDNIKSEIVRTINLFLGHQTFQSAMGGLPRRGVLFEGPPGTGKTFVAKAMAREANVPFLFVSASAFQSMFYGQTNRKIRAYFKALRKYARAEGGAIGFIEEIDAIGGARHGMGGGRPGDGVSGVVNELLVQLQSFDQPTGAQRLRGLVTELVNRFVPAEHRVNKPQVTRANVLVVAATNRAGDLDPALVRPGRFDRSIYFGIPGRQSRAEIIDYYLARKSHDAELDDAGDEIAGMTFGYTPAALERLLDEALIVALSQGRSTMKFEDIAEAKMSTELGLTDSAVYTIEERRRVATHEAGHATVAHFLGIGRKLDVLSIVKRRDALGLLQHSESEERFMQQRSELETLLRISMGGLAAEQLWFGGDVSNGPSGDLAAATQLAVQMVGAYGMAGTLVSMAAGGGGPFGEGLVDRVLRDESMRAVVEDMLRGALDEARQILVRESVVLEALRDALIERDELVGHEITDVIESVPGVTGRAHISTLRR